MLWYILVIVLVIYFYIKIIKPLSFWKIKNVAYKKGWPLVGNMAPALFGTKPFTEFINDLYKDCKGRYLGAHQFLTPMLIIKDLEILKRITIKDFDSFIDHKGFVSEKADPLFGKNLFALKGSKWKNMRLTFSPAFTGSKMRSMYILMSQCAQNYINHLRQESNSSKKIFEIQISDLFARFVNDAVATCAFGIECNSLRDKNNDFYVNGTSLTFDGIKGLLMFGYTFSPKLMEFFNLKYISDRANDFYRCIVRDTMKKREEEGIYRPDMINLLMEAKKGRLKFEESQDDNVGFATVGESDYMKRSANNEDLTLDVLTSQALVFFVAGFEGVVEAMKILSYELAFNLDIQEKLQFEIDETFMRHDDKITYDVIKEMKYLDMVVSELLRKWPLAIMIDRVCTKAYTIESVNPDEVDVHLDVGDVVWIPIYGIHHDPKYYPDPDRFDPERFSDENKKNINPYAYIPFGVGPRNCIGNRFALMEIKSMFVYLLKNFNLSLTNKIQIPLKLNKFTFGLHIPDIYLGLNPR